jgi:uncharacterized membrane protein
LTRDIFFSPKVTVLSLWGALSDERSGLSFEFIVCTGIATTYINTGKVTVLSLWGALSDERSGLSFEFIDCTGIATTYTY